MFIVDFADAEDRWATLGQPDVVIALDFVGVTCERTSLSWPSRFRRQILPVGSNGVELGSFGNRVREKCEA